MLTIIDSFILNKDISFWYETIVDDYEDYYNPVFDIKIKFEYVEGDFLISVFRCNSIIVSVYTYDSYSKKTDDEILDNLLKMVWEIINEDS
jgi:hypothetical protein